MLSLSDLFIFLPTLLPSIIFIESITATFNSAVSAGAAIATRKLDRRSVMSGDAKREAFRNHIFCFDMTSPIWYRIQCELYPMKEHRECFASTTPRRTSPVYFLGGCWPGSL